MQLLCYQWKHFSPEDHSVLEDCSFCRAAIRADFLDIPINTHSYELPNRKQHENGQRE